jgi:hypothetical protein
MIYRTATKELLNLASQYKAVAVMGPRQSGKTTLVRASFADKPYVSLENLDTRTFAKEDPRGFLASYPKGAIFDEVQRVPSLFSYLQQVLDEVDETGFFILTGSNNFLLQENIAQSLAGRVAHLRLLPLSLEELDRTKEQQPEYFIFKGMYPSLYEREMEVHKWYTNYIQTYIEKDIRQIKYIADLSRFELFVRLCAGRVGQLLNVNNLAIEAGIDNKTVTSWLGLLESSFIVFRLKPHHTNFNKRLVKMSKLYFCDTGLALALLGVNRQEQLNQHPVRGAIFENFIIAELLKQRYNRGLSNNLYFWRDNSGHEIDLLLDEVNQLHPIEIKSGKTITNDFFKSLIFWQKLTGKNEGTVLYAGDQVQKRSDGLQVLPWRRLAEMAEVS